MISVRVLLKSHEFNKFVAFSLDEAYQIVHDEFDISNVISIHFYPD